MSIVLTEKAAKEVQRAMDEQDRDDVMLRIGVKGGGCSGFQHALEFDDTVNEEADMKI